MSLVDEILNFYFSLPKTFSPPNDVEVIFPFNYPETRRVMETFYRKYYNDTAPRTLLLGINLGRNGAGLTGVCFTDPILMEEKCGISNNPGKTQRAECHVHLRGGGSVRRAESVLRRFPFQYCSAVRTVA